MTPYRSYLPASKQLITYHTKQNLSNIIMSKTVFEQQLFYTSLDGVPSPERAKTATPLSFSLFNYFSFTHSSTHTGFSTTAGIARSQCKGHKSHNLPLNSTPSQLKNVFVSYYFLDAKGGLNMRCCISDSAYIFFTTHLCSF